MDLKKILTVAGQPDLFEIIKNTNRGIIVESIITKKRTQVFANQRVNTLEDIAVFTIDGEIPLKEVFLKFYKALDGKPTISHKSDPGEIKNFFEEYFPEYDKDRVKFSDMKKILKWYNMLLEHGYIDDKEEEDEKKDTEKEENNKEN